MWSLVQSALAAFGGIVIVATALIVAAYGLFKLFAGKWLDSRFAEKQESLKHDLQVGIEAYKNELQKELAAAKVQFDRLGDRATKLNEREFDALAETWGRLCEAYSSTHFVLRRILIGPDIDRMTKEQQADFIANCELAKWEKDELTKEEYKNKYYQTRIFWHRWAETADHTERFRSFFIPNGIFMPKEIEDKFDVIYTLISSALNEEEFNRQPFTERSNNDTEKFFKDGDSHFSDLKLLIRERLSDLSTMAFVGKRD